MREIINLRCVISWCCLLPAACGAQSTASRERAAKPSSTDQHKLMPQLCQGEANDGGAAAALSMVFAYHGHPVPQKILWNELWNADGGTDAQKMVQSARAHGLMAKGVKVEEKEMLDQLPVGSIIHRKDDRFQVVEKVSEAHITVLDPFNGRQVLPIDYFWTEFSGVALIFEEVGGDPC